MASRGMEVGSIPALRRNPQEEFIFSFFLIGISLPAPIGGVAPVSALGWDWGFMS